jgi:hypothetical protein
LDQSFEVHRGEMVAAMVLWRKPVMCRRERRWRWSERGRLHAGNRRLIPSGRGNLTACCAKACSSQLGQRDLTNAANHESWPSDVLEGT